MNKQEAIDFLEKTRKEEDKLYGVKILPIRSCGECTFNTISSCVYDGEIYFTEEEMNVYNYTFPKWCKLEDYKGEL